MGIGSFIFKKKIYCTYFGRGVIRQKGIEWGCVLALT
jgi:hypothetical protein